MSVAWRAEAVKRYRTVQRFIELLLEVIDFRAVEAGQPVPAMVNAAATMAKSRRRYDRAAVAAHEDLVTGSWRPLVSADLLAISPRIRGMTTAQAKSVGGLAEPAGEVVVQVLLIVADPGDVAVGA